MGGLIATLNLVTEALSCYLRRPESSIFISALFLDFGRLTFLCIFYSLVWLIRFFGLIVYQYFLQYYDSYLNVCLTVCVGCRYFSDTFLCMISFIFAGQASIIYKITSALVQLMRLLLLKLPASLKIELLIF